MNRPLSQSPGATRTPRELGFAMPAEWEHHEAIWLSWPHDAQTFPRLERVEAAYLRIIAAIHAGEEVRLLVRDQAMKDRVALALERAQVELSRVRLLTEEYADVWFRDYGPTFLLNRPAGTKALVQWVFNAWGGKYEELKADGRIPERVLREFPVRPFRPGIVMEGGSFDVNGKGTLLTTEQCLLNKNRNPGLRREDLQALLADYLGASRVIWLKNGIAGDDTDGHVDDIARFVSADTVVCASEEDETDENFSVLRENLHILQEARDQNGRRLRVIRLPMPGKVCDAGKRLPASYANFYIGNGVVLVPVFGHPNDEKALEILQRCFPGRKAVGIRCEDLVAGLGAIHCISQQEPAL